MRSIAFGVRAGVVPSDEGCSSHTGADAIGVRYRSTCELLRTQVTVVGAGAAGLYTALCAARQGARVSLGLGHAAGRVLELVGPGRAGRAVSARDSPERHLRDTIAAGRDAVRESAARVLCEEAAEAVSDLARLGVSFDADRSGRLALGLEGGHSVRRIVHAGGAATGRRLVRQLSAVVAEDPGIEVLEGRRAVAAARRRAVGARAFASTTAG